VGASLTQVGRVGSWAIEGVSLSGSPQLGDICSQIGAPVSLMVIESLAAFLRCKMSRLAHSDGPASRYHGRLRGKNGHRAKTPNRLILTHSDTSPSSIDALRKIHSITASARASSASELIKLIRFSALYVER
jgi:hypothetical protein